MKSKAILQIARDILLAYQHMLAPGEPDEAVARVVLAIETELQIPLHLPIFKKTDPWWDCPVFRRVEALEKTVKIYLTPNPYPGDKIGGG